MHPNEKTRLLSSIWKVMEEEDDDRKAREELIQPHLKNSSRNPMIITTIPRSWGWASVWQDGGGGLAVILWSLGRVDPMARKAVEERERRLSSIVQVQVRWIAPHDWVRSKGWPLRNERRA